MQFSPSAIFEACIIASSLSMDAFAASFAYGSNKIKIPFKSVQIINFICSFILGVSLVTGTLMRGCLPDIVTKIICFGILFVIGVIKLLDSVTKSIIRKYNNLNKELEFSMFNFKFILQLYADPEKADVDSSKVISPMEAASLAIALSFDGIAVGFGAAMGNANSLSVFLASLISGPIMILLGCHTGQKAAQKLSLNLSWLSGLILIILAFLKL